LIPAPPTLTLVKLVERISDQPWAAGHKIKMGISVFLPIPKDGPHNISPSPDQQKVSVKSPPTAHFFSQNPRIPSQSSIAVHFTQERRIPPASNRLAGRNPVTPVP